jgi:hypothetical protein
MPCQLEEFRMVIKRRGEVARFIIRSFQQADAIAGFLDEHIQGTKLLAVLGVCSW